MSNVPEDWGNYYTKCPGCGKEYHESEGDCGVCIQCVDCGDAVATDTDDLCDDCREARENDRCYSCGCTKPTNKFVSATPDDGEVTCAKCITLAWMEANLEEAIQIVWRESKRQAPLIDLLKEN